MSYHFEMLESRLLLAASLGVRQKGANLIISGSGGADSIEVLGTGAGSVQVSIDLNGDGDFGDPDEVRTFTGVKNLRINSGSGDDRILVDGLNIPGKFNLNAGSGNDTVAFGSIAGNQVGGKTNVNLGSGDDGMFVEDTSVNGKLTINGGKGNNTIDDAGGNSFPSNAKLKGVQAGDVTPPPAGGGVIPPVIPPVVPGALTASDDLFDVDNSGTVTGNLITGNNGNGPDTGNADPLPLTVTQINGINITNGSTVTLPSGALLTVHTNGDFTFNPNGAINVPSGGSTTTAFTYTLSDGDEIDTGTVSVRVHNPANTLPVAVNDVFTGGNGTDERTPTVIDVLANDTDADFDALKISHIGGSTIVTGGTVTLPSGATVQLNPNGTLTYHPNGAFNHLTPIQQQNDSFTYRVTDGRGGVSTATVTIQITGLDDVPVATDNQYSGIEDNTIFGNVITQNTGAGIDSDDGAFRVGQVTGVGGIAVPVPNGGSVNLFTDQGAQVTMYSDGTFFYSSTSSATLQSLEHGELGTDSFTYQIVDGFGQVSTATVSFTITGRNDIPTDSGESYSLRHDDPNEVGNLLDNAFDPDTPMSVTGPNVGAPVQLFDSSNEVMATVTISANGQFVINPNENYTGGGGTASVTYTVTDGLGSASPSTLTVTINGNSNPSAEENSYTIDQDSTVSGNLITDDTGSGADSDPDPTNVLTVTQINGANITNGQTVTLASGATVKIDTNGVFVYDPNGAFDYVLDNETATDTFQYTISDGRGGTDTAEVTVTIDGLNDAPVANDDEFEVFEDEPFQDGEMFANDIENDTDDTLTLKRIVQKDDMGNVIHQWDNVIDGQVIVLDSGAFITVHLDGGFIYSPNDQMVFESLGVGQTREESFWYVMADEDGVESNEAKVTVTVNGQNDAPYITLGPGFVQFRNAFSYSDGTTTHSFPSGYYLSNEILSPGAGTTSGSLFAESGVGDVDENHTRDELRLVQVNYNGGTFSATSGTWSGGNTVSITQTGNYTNISITNFGTISINYQGLWTFNPDNGATGTAVPVNLQFAIRDPEGAHTIVVHKIFDVQ